MKPDSIREGVIHADSIGSRATDIVVLRPFLWLLNMMSHYRDLKANGKRNNINFISMFKGSHDCGYHMFLMGLEGPFGNLFVDNVKTMPFPLLVFQITKRFRNQMVGTVASAGVCLFMIQF